MERPVKIAKAAAALRALSAEAFAWATAACSRSVTSPMR